MSDEGKDLIAIKLDAERRREIDGVKERMEEFLRQQINVENELKLVVKGQDGLKERFEMGVAKTLKELDHKFDGFMMEWGKKQSEDSHRDNLEAVNGKGLGHDGIRRSEGVWHMDISGVHSKRDQGAIHRKLPGDRPELHSEPQRHPLQIPGGWFPGHQRIHHQREEERRHRGIHRWIENRDAGNYATNKRRGKVARRGSCSHLRWVRLQGDGC